LTPVDVAWLTEEWETDPAVRPHLQPTRRCE